MTESKTFNRVSTILLAVLVTITMLPIILIVISSFTDETYLLRNGYSFLPKAWSTDAYYYILKQGAVIARAYFISFFTTIVGTSASVLLTSTLAYPMARKSFKYRNVRSFFVFFTMLFNGGIVPSYIMWTRFFHIKNTLWALLI
ncbi:MAG: carbohydrate ABC transporter permease, partial [Blautia sp.]|nr:carbohydrate ABC transporter permease [Blautia sp.]